MTTTATTPLENKEVTLPPVLVAQCHSASSPAPEAVAAAMRTAFGKVEAFLQQYSLRAAGPPRAIYTGWGANSVEFTAAIPIPDVPPSVLDSQDVKITAMPECSALRFVHHGPYSELPGTYARIEGWLRERGGIKAPEDWAHYSPMWEEYQNDPATTPPSDLLTYIFLTLR